MNTIRHSGGPIIVAVDRSEHAYDATEWAAELAAALGAALHLVHVAPAGAHDRTPDTDREATWLGMLRVAAWRAGTDPDIITTVRDSLATVMTELAPGARLVVLGVDLSAHPEVETATVSVLVEKKTSPVAVVRGHQPGLCAPMRGPVVVAGGPVVPDFAAEIAARLRAPVESVDIEAEDAQTSMAVLLDRAHRARLVVLDPPDHLSAPGGWFDDASRLLIEQATCPVVVLGAVDHGVRAGTPAEPATTSP
jgi:nucleotide-binding universal stress UspA family protein